MGVSEEFGIDPPRLLTKRRRRGPNASRLVLAHPEPETDQADLPQGPWPVFNLLEAILTTSLHADWVDTNMLVGHLTQFETDEMPRVKVLFDRIIVAAEDIRRMIKPLRLAQTQTREPMRQLERATGSLPAPLHHKVPSYPDAVLAEFQWSVRQILSVIQFVLCTEDTNERALELAVEELRIYGQERCDHVGEAAELVIMAAAIAHMELTAMMHPPG